MGWGTPGGRTKSHVARVRLQAHFDHAEMVLRGLDPSGGGLGHGRTRSRTSLVDCGSQVCGALVRGAERREGGKYLTRQDPCEISSGRLARLWAATGLRTGPGSWHIRRQTTVAIFDVGEGTRAPAADGHLGARTRRTRSTVLSVPRVPDQASAGHDEAPDFRRGPANRRDREGISPGRRLRRRDRGFPGRPGRHRPRRRRWHRRRFHRRCRHCRYRCRRDHCLRSARRRC